MFQSSRCFIAFILLCLTGIVEAKLSEQELNSLKLQIFLDQSNFTPGYLDARPGKFTMQAIHNYNRKHGKDITDIGLIQQAQTEIETPLALAVVPSFAARYVDSSLPTSRPLQAKRKSMPYRSYAEFMAERYHTSVGLLRKINSSSAMSQLGPRKSILVPNITPFLIEKLRGGKNYHADAKLARRVLVIDTTINQLKIYQLPPLEPLEGKPAPLNSVKFPTVESLEDMHAYEVKLAEPLPLIYPKRPEIPDKELFDNLKDTDLIATFPITPGKPQFIRRGYWKIKSSVELPIWRFDKKLLETGVRGKESLIIPGGPNNPVGVMWNGLTRRGIGIHGTSSPETIGRSQSAGCIRLANWDVVKIPQLIRPGAKVWLK